jgi:murein DD-endopeptidase MepM/ murein hydrolase activator NlpD
VQPDTIIAEPGSTQGLNRFSYSKNNPINFVDPSGNVACEYNKVGLCVANKDEQKRVPTTFLNAMQWPTNPITTYVKVNYGHQNTMDNNEDMLIDRSMSKEEYLEKWGIHAGVDIKPNNAGTNVPIYAVYEGVVVYASEDTTGMGGGTQIVIKHELDGKVNYSFYYHLDTMTVDVGQHVETEDQIGTMGDTGSEGAVHLHFEVRTEAGVGAQPDDGGFVYPGGSQFWWANSSQELKGHWVDISPKFGGYDDFLPEGWR